MILKDHKKKFFFFYLIKREVLEIIRRRQWHPTPVLLPGKSHGWRSLVGCSPWGRYSWTQLSDFTFTFHFHALEREMATHSSVLAWRIPGTGEPGGLPYLGLHRVGHDWSDAAAAAAAAAAADASLKGPAIGHRPKCVNKNGFSQSPGGYSGTQASAGIASAALSLYQ